MIITGLSILIFGVKLCLSQSIMYTDFGNGQINTSQQGFVRFNTIDGFGISNNRVNGNNPEYSITWQDLTNSNDNSNGNVVTFNVPQGYKPITNQYSNTVQEIPMFEIKNVDTNHNIVNTVHGYPNMMVLSPGNNNFVTNKRNNNMIIPGESNFNIRYDNGNDIVTFKDPNDSKYQNIWENIFIPSKKPTANTRYENLNDEETKVPDVDIRINDADSETLTPTDKYSTKKEAQTETTPKEERSRYYQAQPVVPDNEKAKYNGYEKYVDLTKRQRELLQ